MRTVFLAVYHPYSSRNVLSNGMVENLIAQKDIRVVVFCQAIKKDFFVANYSQDRIIIESFSDDRKTFFSSVSMFFDRWTTWMLPTFTIGLRMREKLYRRKNLKSFIIFFLESACFLLGRFKIWRRFVRWLDYRLADKSFLDDFIDKYQPDLFLASDIFSPEETMFMMACRAKKIPIISMVRSWDGTTNKRIFRILPDYLLASNLFIKNEAIKYHDMSANKIFVTGMPQYDLYCQYLEKIKKETPVDVVKAKDNFFRTMGLDPLKRLILFAPAGDYLTDIDWQILEIIKQAQGSGRLPNDIQFLVRQHPSLPANLSRFSGGKNFIIEKPPGAHFTSRYRMTEMDKDSVEHLCDSLRFSDVLIQFSSTIGLDESVFDLPQIMVAFDGWENKPYIDSVKRYHDEINMKYFISLKPAVVAKNEQEMIDSIDIYLKNRFLNSEGRTQAIKDIIFLFDGFCAQRISDFILKKLPA